MKTGKYVSLGYYKDVKIGYGTVDYRNLKTIYIKLNSWLLPESDDERIDVVLSKAKRKIKLRILNQYSGLLKKESIVDLDVRVKGIKIDKKSFLNLEVTLFTDKSFDFRSKDLGIEIENLIHDIIDEDLDDKNLFNFHRNKK